MKSALEEERTWRGGKRGAGSRVGEEEEEESERASERSGAVYMAKGASPEPYRSLTLKFKETDNSFPFRRASVLQYHIPFLSFHCLVKPALIIKDCYPGSYARRGREREREGWDKGEMERVRREERRACERRNRRKGRTGWRRRRGFGVSPRPESFQVRCYIIRIAGP